MSDSTAAFDRALERAFHQGRGYITSVTWSTELNKFIALGLYHGGLRHEGEEIIAAFPLKNEQARLKIVSPHFIDKEGARLNA